MDDWPTLAAAAARWLLAAVFLYSAVDKTLRPRAALAEIAAQRLPFPPLALAATLAVQWLGGLALASGVGVPIGAAALAAFTLAATAVAHRPWQAPPGGRVAAVTVLLEHLAIVGGLLALAVVFR